MYEKFITNIETIVSALIIIASVVVNIKTKMALIEKDKELHKNNLAVVEPEKTTTIKDSLEANLTEDFQLTALSNRIELATQLIDDVIEKRNIQVKNLAERISKLEKQLCTVLNNIKTLSAEINVLKSKNIKN